MSNYYDLKSILDIQKNAIVDLSNVYPGTSDEALQRKLQELQNNLNALNTAYTAADSEVRLTLTQQNQIKDIINKETERLNAKKSSIDKEMDFNKRMLGLNDSSTKNKKAYVNMIVVIVIILILYIIIVKLNQSAILPSGLADFFIILLFGSGIIYLFIMWREINVRNNMDFDKLNIPPPKTMSEEELKKFREKAASEGRLSDLMNNAGVCTGQSCCFGTNQVWENGVNKCITPPSDGNLILVDTTMVVSENGNQVTKNSGDQVVRTNCVGPNFKICGNACIRSEQTCREGFTSNVPFEFDSYASYK
jgi:hypothetical protein